MGFSLRKSVAVGPFRFTLSGSGLGASVGTSGMRLGTGPRGTYVSVGAHGVTYRQTVGGRSAPHATVPEGRSNDVDVPSEITSGDVSQMRDASSEELVRQLNTGLRVADLATPTLVLLAVALLLVVPAAYLWTLVEAEQGRLPSELLPLMHVGLAGAMALPPLALVAAGLARRRYRLRSTTVLLYDLDAETESAFTEVCEGLDELAGCAGAWHVATQARTADWKRNAGASTLITRTPGRRRYTDPVGSKTNITVPSLPAGREALYFTPDRLLVYDARRRTYGALAYSDVTLALDTSIFIEDGAAPRDAEIVRRTWAKVNKDGSPDRRFAQNRQLPVCRYGEFTLTSPTGLLERFQFSRLGAADRFAGGLRRLGVRVEGGEAAAGPRSVAEAPPDDSRLPVIALASLLRYVAAADRKFTDTEREHIREALREEFPDQAWLKDGADAVVDAIPTDASMLPAAFAMFRNADEAVRRRVLGRAEALTVADGKATPKERERIAEIRAGLALGDV